MSEHKADWQSLLQKFQQADPNEPIELDESEAQTVRREAVQQEAKAVLNRQQRRKLGMKRFHG